MKRKNNTKKGDDRRSEPRSNYDQYSSLEFSLNKINYLYQFKIWDVSPSGMSILVKEDSNILKHIEIGDMLDMKYYLKESSEGPVILNTEIRHITRDVPERISGHVLIGLSTKKSTEGLHS
jgi:hypothetical protein